MSFTAAKMLNSLAVLQGLYFSTSGDGNAVWFLFFSLYLYFFSVAEYCEGAFQVRRVHPGLSFFVARGAMFALLSPALLLASGAATLTASLALLFWALPFLSYKSGPAQEKSGDRAFLAVMVIALAMFSGLLWTQGPALAFVAYLVLYSLAAFLRGRVLSGQQGVPKGTKLSQLSIVAFLAPAPRYMDLLFLYFIGAGQVEMAASLGFRVANISVRLPMFIYANYLPSQIPHLGAAFRGKPFAIATIAALTAFAICYCAVAFMVDDVNPLPLAIYALAICVAAYTGEVLRFFASGGTLLRVNLLAPALMVPVFVFFYHIVGVPFDLAFAGCFCISVVPLVVWAWRREYQNLKGST